MRFDLWVTSTLFPWNPVGVVQFKIHSCFRTGARQRNRHTLLQKLALVDTVYTPMARVVQIKIRSCFRAEVHPRNQHTLIPKLVLEDTVYTPMARVLNLKKEGGFFSKSEGKCDLEYFCPKRREKRILDYIYPSKREEESKARRE